MDYDLITTRNVADALLAVPTSTQERYFKTLSILAAVPENSDDEPPIPCRFYPIPDTTKTIFYSIDHASEMVKVFALIDQGRNPAYRFREIRQSDMNDIS